MAGLLEKDFRIILQRKSSLLIFVAMGIMFAFTRMDSFVVSYLTILGMILGLGTISYDEFDNGMPFIMSLPVNEKIYAIEKYVFLGICGGISWIFAMIIYLGTGLIRGGVEFGKEDIIGAIAVIAVMWIMLDVMVPVQIKFGAEKSRIFYLIIIGAAMIAGFAAKKGIEASDISVVEIIEKLDRISDVVIGLGVAAATVIATVISAMCSISILKKKEY